MIDLAKKLSDTAPAMPGGENSSYCPSLRLDKDQLKAMGLGKIGLGDTYEVTVHLKATSISQDGTSFDVVKASEDPVEVAESAEDHDEDTEKETEKPKARILTPKDMKKGRSAYGD